MRILVSTSTLPVALDDGIPRFIYDLAESLAHSVEVILLAPGVAGVAPSSKLGSLEVRRFDYFWPRALQRLTPSGGQGMSEKFRGSWLARLQVPAFLAQQCRATRRLVRSLRIDVVNAHWIVPQGLTAAVALGRRRRARLVLHVHAGDVYLLRRLVFGKAIARYVIGRCDAVFADGSHVRDSLDELLGFSSGAKLRPMGVRLDVFRAAGDATAAANDAAGHHPACVSNVDSEFPQGYLLFFGRLVEKKGVVYLIRALPQVLEQFPELRLVILGSGPCEQQVRDEIGRLSLERRVLMLGHKSHAEIARYLRGCRLAVVPSIIDSRGETEGMPTVVLEAMASGAPVVASRVDGIPDVIRHGQNGWLCRQQDFHDLADTIITAMRASPRAAVQNAALETAKEFSWQQVAESYLRCFQALGDVAGAGAGAGAVKS